MTRKERKKKADAVRAKMPVGRPRLFNSPEDLEKAIEAYFEACDSRLVTITVDGPNGQVDQTVRKPAPYSMADLCRMLGFLDRWGLREYSANYPEYSAAYKKARLRIEGQRERFLYEPPKGAQPACTIFDLKCNYDWRDKQEVAVDVTSGGKPLPSASDLLALIEQRRKESSTDESSQS